MQALEFKDVSVEFSGRKALDQINLQIAQNHFVVVFGPNGAGKSTLLKLVIGELSPSAGSVSVFGQSVAKGLRQVGYVPQSILAQRTFPIKVIDCVMMGRLGQIGLFRRPKSSDYDLCNAALGDVGLSDFGQKYFGELSGGQRQRVFIARALVSQPKLLLMDEATSGVDAGAKESLFELLIRLKDHMTVLFVTHDLSVISKAVDMVVCLNRTLVSHGKPEVALSDHAMKCMYGEHATMFSHCSTPHVHVEGHS